MGGFHSRLSPSGAHRYLNCHAAPSAEEGLPNWESIYAFEGTCLHEIAERCLLDGGDPHRFIGEIFESDPEENKTGKPYVVEITEEHADCMVADLQMLRDLFDGEEIHVETRGDLTWPLGEGESGTSDIAGRTRKTPAVHIADWKFGSGIVVEAKENWQLMLYGIGSIVKHWPELLIKDPVGGYHPANGFEDLPVHLHILQPRAVGGGGHWETTLGALLEWGHWVDIVVSRKVNAENPEYKPGDKQCQWCAAATGDPLNGRPPCAARTALALEIAQELLPDLDMDDYVDLGMAVPKTATTDHGMPIDKAVWIYENRVIFAKFLEEVGSRLRKDLEHGRPVPRKKLVEGRMAPRKFKKDVDEELLEILKPFTDQIYEEPKLKSPTQMESTLGKDVYDMLVSAYVTREPGKPAIVDTDNEKPALSTFTDDLEELD